MTFAAPQADGAETVGDLAIVLHSHMPYVEGFGTYPFGEEWLFDAVVRSYLPVLEVARDLTMTVTPVLADQLEDAATMGRLRDFLVEHRVGAAEADARDLDPDSRPAAANELARYGHALELLDRGGGDVLGLFREAQDSGRVALAASAATHAVLPLLATRAGLDLQMDAGLRSHRRRFGWEGGFWLPECAYVPGLEARLAEHGVRWFCLNQSAHEPAGAALAPVATDTGPVAFTIDWEAVQWLWSLGGYPSSPPYAQFAGRSMRGTRMWKIGGGPYDPGVAEAAARRQAAEFCATASARLQRFRESGGGRGLLVFAVDTELIGHWWSEGPTWLAEVLRVAPEHRLRLQRLPEALNGHEAQARPLQTSSWGEGADLRTWDSARVADLAWGARRSELRLLRALGRGLGREAATRAARELLALQSSDWAFLDGRRQAGEYAFLRAINHSRAMLEAIHSSAPSPEPRMRALAPDLNLAPLLRP
jgi:1,4-alpha-glucan branching enzyme